MSSTAQTTPAVPPNAPIAASEQILSGSSDRPARGNYAGRQRGSRGNFNGQRGARRGAGQNRGNRANGDHTQRSRRVSVPENRPAPTLPPPPGLGGGGSFDTRLTKDAEIMERETQTEDPDAKEDEVEAEVCFICASKVEHNAVAPCNHRTCHICALRLRALYKTRACAHCRVSHILPFYSALTDVMR